jgi:hypothetical protein
VATKKINIDTFALRTSNVKYDHCRMLASSIGQADAKMKKKNKKSKFNQNFLNGICLSEKNACLLNVKLAYECAVS